MTLTEMLLLMALDLKFLRLSNYQIYRIKSIPLTIKPILLAVITARKIPFLVRQNFLKELTLLIFSRKPFFSSGRIKNRYALNSVESRALYSLRNYLAQIAMILSMAM